MNLMVVDERFMTNLQPISLNTFLNNYKFIDHIDENTKNRLIENLKLDILVL